MTRAVAVLRPEPGNAATCARVRALGREAVAMPLFAVRPLGWAVPEGRFDALLLTSANAVRHAGGGLATVRALPVVAVGEATAAAARASGLSVVVQGAGDAAQAAALARGRGYLRLLHLGGRETRVSADMAASVPVYASEPVSAPAVATLAGTTALLHSARAAARLAALMPEASRGEVRLAALSGAVAAAAGTGWAAIGVAALPTDAALLEAALLLD